MLRASGSDVASLGVLPILSKLPAACGIHDFDTAALVLPGELEQRHPVFVYLRSLWGRAVVKLHGNPIPIEGPNDSSGLDPPLNKEVNLLSLSQDFK